MKLVTVTASFAPEDVSKSVDILKALELEARNMDGLISYDICRNCKNESDVLIIQGWENAAAFEAYRNSAAFAQMGASIKSLMTAAPETIIYDATRMD